MLVLLCYKTWATTLRPSRQRLDRPSAKGLAHACPPAPSATASLPPGDRLPPIRRWPRDLELSPTTVSAALGAARPGRHASAPTVGAARGGRTDRARWRRATRGRCDTQSAVQPRPVDRASPTARCCPASRRVLVGLPTAAHPEQLPRRPRARPSCATCWPRTGRTPPRQLTVVDGAMDALDLFVADPAALRRPGRRREPGLPTAARPARGPRASRSSACRSTTRASTSTASRRLLPRRRPQRSSSSRGPEPDRGVDVAHAARADLAAVLRRPTTASSSRTTRRPDLAVAADQPRGSGSRTRCCTSAASPSRTGPTCGSRRSAGAPRGAQPSTRRRQLGQGWTSRLLQRILVGLLTDRRRSRPCGGPAPRTTPASDPLVDALAEHGVEVGGAEGLNIWVPVHDESAAVVRLASQGIGVSAGAPFAVLPEPRGFIRVTAGLVPDRHAEIAAAIAEAAHTGSWGSRAR